MANFILEFPLKIEAYQKDILNRRFEIGRHIYNSVANVSLKRYKEMIKTKRYRTAEELYEMDKKTANKEFKTLYKEYRLSEYELHKDVKRMQQHFKKSIDSSTAQKIATNLWKAYDRVFFGTGKRIHFKKFGELNVLTGKSNKTGIRYKGETILWNGLTLPVIIDKNNPYETEAFTNEIAYCSIVRRWIRKGFKYYAQIVFKGTPPAKRCKNTGYFKRTVGNGDVGIDIGASTVAVVSEQESKLILLADKVQLLENQKRLIQRKLDRSRRAMNPDYFNSNGTVNNKRNKRWKNSNKYKLLQGELRELYRKQAAVRKYQHECLANEIIAQGDKVYVETMSFSGLKKCSKKTTVNERTGKFNKKKRFGKSIANRAPAMLLTIIDRKLSYHGKTLVKINTTAAKASQYNHLDQSYKKKELSERWNVFGNIKVQRDLYSAFLLMNINEDLSTFNQEKCEDRFENFLTQHDIEVQKPKTRKII